MKEANLFFARPRGFCAGVIRAIGIVEDALEQYGAPVYVRGEIVHNKYVVKDLENKGAVFVKEIDEIQKDRPLVFSAHGVPQSLYSKAETLGLKYLDATCPLVKKVHRAIVEFYNKDMEIIVIGKKDHPEIIGTVGQIPADKKVHIINSAEEVAELKIDSNAKVGFITQTTLSVDDAKDIIAAIKNKFPNAASQKEGDICYATANRQKAVRELAEKADAIIILGSKNSSNSNQLREAALKSGAKQAYLIDDYSELDWDKIKNAKNIGISAGASAPEYLVEDLLEAFSKHYDKINVHHVIVAEEKSIFKGL